MIKFITFFVIFMIFAVFMLLIVPIWLGLHYRWKAKVRDSLSEEAAQRMSTLQSQADKLEQRIKVLESILDKKVSDWRK